MTAGPEQEPTPQAVQIQQHSARRRQARTAPAKPTTGRRTGVPPTPQRRRRPQGYQEQTLDFSGGNVSVREPQLRICGQQHPVSPADGATAQQPEPEPPSGPAEKPAAAGQRHDRLPHNTGAVSPQWPAAPERPERPEAPERRALPPHGGEPPQPGPAGGQKEAPSDPGRCPPPQGHPPPDGAGAAALRHRGGRLPHRDHALQDQHPSKWRSDGAGGAARWAAIPAPRSCRRWASTRRRTSSASTPPKRPLRWKSSSRCWKISGWSGITLTPWWCGPTRPLPSTPCRRPAAG